MMPDTNVIHPATGSPPKQAVHGLSGIGPWTPGSPPLYKVITGHDCGCRRRWQCLKQRDNVCQSQHLQDLVTFGIGHGNGWS